MKSYPPWLLLLIGTVFLLLAPGARAGSLSGKVIDINDGDTLTVFNLNRPVQVRILGVDAPESNQAFGEVAKQHLRDLVLEKFVSVEYWGLGQQGAIVGKVKLNEVDVGAQMIRDGVAWFDVNNKSRLSAADREIYFQSEQAARTELRGLWQGEAPVAPWEFVKAELARRRALTGSDAPVVVNVPRTTRPTPELTNLTLLASPGAGRSGSAAVNANWYMPDVGKKNWERFQVKGEDFSVLIPEAGKRSKQTVAYGKGIDFNFYLAREGVVTYTLMWVRAPRFEETVDITIRGALRTYLVGLGQNSDTRRRAFMCEPQVSTDISQGGYTGREYDLGSCLIPARVRVFAKPMKGEWQVYVGGALFMQDDPNVGKFLSSFTVNRVTTQN